MTTTANNRLNEISDYHNEIQMPDPENQAFQNFYELAGGYDEDPSVFGKFTPGTVCNLSTYKWNVWHTEVIAVIAWKVYFDIQGEILEYSYEFLDIDTHIA